MIDAGIDGLTTARLQLPRFTLDDEALLYRLNSDASVMRYLDGPMKDLRVRKCAHDTG